MCWCTVTIMRSGSPTIRDWWIVVGIVTSFEHSLLSTSAKPTQFRVGHVEHCRWQITTCLMVTWAEKNVPNLSAEPPQQYAVIPTAALSSCKCQWNTSSTPVTSASYTMYQQTSSRFTTSFITSWKHCCESRWPSLCEVNGKATAGGYNQGLSSNGQLFMVKQRIVVDGSWVNDSWDNGSWVMLR